MRWIMFLGIVAVAMFILNDYVLMRMRDRQDSVIKREALMVLARGEAARMSDTIWAKMRNAHTLEEWEHIFIEELAVLEGEDAKFASAVSKSKLFEARLWTAEYFLVGAGKLLAYDVNHPAAKKYMDRARELYEKNEGIVNGLQEERGNPEWNAYLNYLKGVHYFRSLLFVKKPSEEQSKVEELVSQSALHLGKVFAWLPKDNDTEIALEVLQKKSKEMLSASGSDESLRLQLKLLPSKEVGPEFLIGGKQEGKH